MKKLIILALVAMTLGSAQVMAAEKNTTLYAVKFHGDWCGSCKAMAPKIEKARGKYNLDNKNVLFVKLDLTNKATRNQAELMAKAIGIDKFYKKHSGKTGVLWLIDANTGKSVGKITNKHSADQIAAMIKKQST